MPNTHPVVKRLIELSRVENLTLIKANGQEIPDISLFFSANEFKIPDGNLSIVEGDTFRRVLKNGDVEEYVVLDRGYHSGGVLKEMSPHYEAKVRKKTVLPDLPPVSNTYNVAGENSRININSTDHSTNIVNTGDDDLFSGLRKAIENQIKDEVQRELILKRLADMEATQKTSSFNVKYQAFIEEAANHMTIIAPFIPQLTQLLTGHP